MAAAIAARQPAPAKQTALELGMQLLAHLLQGDAAAQWRDVAALEALALKAPGDQRQQLASEVVGLIEVLARQSNDPDLILKSVELRLAKQPAAGDAGCFELPDLVTLVGPKRAEAILRKGLLTRGVSYSVPAGDATRRLAQRLALELVAKLKSPQWALPHSLDATKLYEALEKRFPVAKRQAPQAGLPGAMMPDREYDPQQQEWEIARLYYPVGLVVAGKTKEAAGVAARLPAGEGGGYLQPNLVRALEGLGAAHSKTLSEFFRAALTKNPDLPFWEVYVTTAARAGETNQLLDLLRAVSRRPALSQERRRELRSHLYRALLAGDRVDEGIELLKQMLKEGGAALPIGGYNPTSSSGLELARLGQLLNRKEWLDEGLQAALEAAAQAPEGGYDGGATGGLAQLLLELGRGPEAEQLLLAQLVEAARQGNEAVRAADLSPGGSALVELAGLYHATGRHADVLLLLAESPDWGAKDLSEILLQADSRDVPVGHMAAAALAATGKKDQAVAVTGQLLEARDDFDPAYELLLELRGAAALPLIDRLAGRDAFEERPLIWKAALLLKTGRLEEAEKAVRAAIAIDPSDGEQKHGRRMRVYAVLADILAARGDQAGATLFRGAVKAIRVSEQADQYYVAGLLQRGIRLYVEALSHFADAYCIQSRLAVQLAQQGRLPEAAMHYRRAYELMPDSFGRLETHCFGCEGVFAGRQAETIAEEVFQALSLRTPEKPQVHYLLGYLREHQERYPEALAHFRAAVARDPDYLNAWQHIQSVSEQVHVPPADREATVLNLLRLDPLRRHVEPDLSSLTNLRALWDAVAAARRVAKSESRPDLYPLPAAATAVEKLAALTGEAMMRRMRPDDFDPEMAFERYPGYPGYPGRDRAGRPLPPPGHVIASHMAVAAAANLVENEPISMEP